MCEVSVYVQQCMQKYLCVCVCVCTYVSMNVHKCGCVSMSVAVCACDHGFLLASQMASIRGVDTHPELYGTIKYDGSLWILNT